MLKSWSIENFKAIVNSGELKLAPVTILAGKNSSGKSSLIQSILMIAQTLSNQNRDLALLTNGDLTKLRTYEDILSDYTTSRNITIRFGLDNKRTFINGQEILGQTITITFDSANSNKAASSAIEASKVAVEDATLNILIESEGFIYDDNGHLETDKRIISNEFELEIRRGDNDEIERFLASELRNKPSHVGVIKLDGVALTQIAVTLFHFLPIDFINSKKADISEYDFYSATFGIRRGVEQSILFFTSHIRYLGPLRADPGLATQEFSTKGNLDDVGLKGEFAATVYHANQKAEIDWYNPQSKQVERGTLKVALDSWARHLSVAHQVTTEMAEFIGVSWKVVLIEGQKARSLSDVGVGLSQILPILVMGLLSPKDSLLIMEQPELHLHPKVQAGLGDFFVGLAKSGKQCLIETHSENIVSQLRYQIVEAGGQDKSDCIIYFVDQDETGAAKFEPVEISPNGNILNWPDGFFDETMLQEDRITAASIRKRAKKAKNG